MKKNIKLKIRLGRNIFKKSIEAAKFIIDVFDENLRSDRFCKWFVNELGFDSKVKFCDYLEFTEKKTVQCRRYNSLSKTICKNVYEFWKSTLTISIDQRNDRNVVKISRSKLPS